MNIFTKEDIAVIRKRMAENPAYLKKIDNETRNVMRKLYIQKTGIGTWYHYFTCPNCGARLTFDYDNNETFTCSNCNGVYTGEPYVGAWWEAVLCKTTDAGYKLAIAYVGTSNKRYFEKAKQILIGYANNYKNYEVHGDIPYNKPGRFLSQVLSDCEPIWNLSRAYALLKSDLSDSECSHIENDLLRPAAYHQKTHLTPQLHNHEVAICASIASAAMAIGDEELLEFALNDKYGLKYQLDHSFFEDDFWFEGSSSYHQYALFWYAVYESVTKNTKYSLLNNKRYADKLLRASKFFKNLHVGNNCSVRLNDGNPYIGNPLIYEILYAHSQDNDLLPFLSASYTSNMKREDSTDALVYGSKVILDDVPALKKETYLSEVGSNLAMIHGTDDRYLCFKALPYSGEHDHYDRLSVSFDAFRADACVDFGTASGYGSPYHYNYFKNTATHNTVVINGENMSPCDSVVNKYIYTADDDILLDAKTLPPDNYVMPDTFTIKQWNDEAYRGVTMRRVISWHDKYFIDVFSINSDNLLRKEWTWHVNAERTAPINAKQLSSVSKNGPQSYFKNAYSIKSDGIIKCQYSGKDFLLDIYTLAKDREIIFAEGPGNPTNETVSYLLERTYEKCPIYVNVIEAYRGASIINCVSISVEDNKVSVTITEKSGKVRKLNVDI